MNKLTNGKPISKRTQGAGVGGALGVLVIVVVQAIVGDVSAEVGGAIATICAYIGAFAPKAPV